MPTPLTRRTLIVGGLAAVAGCSSPSPPSGPPPAEDRFAALETRFGGRIGVYALDTGSGAVVAHRGDERFLLASTCKVFIVAGVLHRAATDPGLLERVVRYDAGVLLANSPVTERFVGTGMTVADLCGATITVSDNAAANLLLDVVGGPSAVTGFVRGLGDGVTRVDRPEPDLNESTGPDDERDTSTPAAVVQSLRAVLLGDGLHPAGRDRLDGWLAAATTGDATIRAGVPAGWRVGDKTGTGAQGERNDIAVLRPPGRAPVLLAVYTAPDDPDVEPSDAVVAEATRIAVAAPA